MFGFMCQIIESQIWGSLGISEEKASETWVTPGQRSWTPSLPRDRGSRICGGEENEDDIPLVSEGALRPVLECIDLVSSDDEEPSTSHNDESFKLKDYNVHQKDKVARLEHYVKVEKQQKEEKNRAFRDSR
ncbi:Zinc finger protein 451 [Heterocephalus glaber]|uniref:Zinc finger protein 451 n=1 Tax=Heterocephalus glaber TaxID=10181 RepID=G5B9T2_HETGA|nr:Zinc finger protein 451 [Heterocephalus glaber]